MAYRIRLVAILSILSLGCGNGYAVKDNKVFLEQWNEAVGYYETLADSADAKTFKTLDFNCGCSLKFGRDEKSLFIDAVRLSV